MSAELVQVQGTKNTTCIGVLEHTPASKSVLKSHAVQEELRKKINLLPGAGCMLTIQTK
jgi:hypothetical protein